MKTMKLLPLKIAVTSAMIIGLGAASTANAQVENQYLEQIQNLLDKQSQNPKPNQKPTPQDKFQNYVLSSHVVATKEINNSVETLYKNTEDLYKTTDDIYKNIEGLIEYIHVNDETDQKQTKAIDALNKASSANTDRIATAELGIAENKKDAQIAKAQANVNKTNIQYLKQAQLVGLQAMDELNKNIEENKVGIQKNANSVQNLKTLYETSIRTVGNNEKAIKEHQKLIADNKAAADADFETLTKNQNALIEQGEEHGRLIAANKADADAKFKGVQTDIANNKITLAEHTKKIDDNRKAIEAKLGGKVDAQKLVDLEAKVNKNKAAADADFETLTKNQNALIEQDEAINRELEGFAAYNELQDAYAKQQTEAIDALNKASDENTRNIEDLAAYNELQDQYAQKQTDAIDALNKASSENTQNIEDLAAYNELQDQYAKKQTEAIDALNKASSENTQNIEDLAAYNELQDAYAKQQTDAIDALNKASSANTDRIATAELGIAENKKDAQIAKAQANENKDGIAKNQADIQLHDQKINNLGILHTLVSRAVGNNTQGVATNKADIAKNNESIEDLYEANNENVERIAQIDNNVFVNRLNIQELKRKQESDIKDVVGMQNAIAEQADKNKNNIQDLAKAQLAGVTVMEELNKNVEKNKADADANFETLTKNQNTLIEKDKEHDKLITANKTAIDANKASADAKFAATTDALTKHGQDITKNAKSITDLGTKVDGFDGRVTALDTKVNGFDGRISALDTKVNAFDGRITALDSKVENGMAAQAALSGLFQPYSVGKFNATAALGGYGSKSAVAIGAGYRVNPNLAFKAGAAINTSGDKKGSYNIGVNYEF